MSLIERLGRHSFLYTLAIMLQRGTAFVLLPLYTHVLTPAEYGTVAIITALNGILVVLLPLALHAAVTRFYFEYRNDSQALREFWGTLLVSMTLCCTVLGGVLLLFGTPLFAVLLGDVAFWPYVVIGICTAMIQPFFQVVQSIYQAREQPLLFATISFGHFLFTLLLTLFLVLVLDWRGAAPLAAMLASSLFFSILGLVVLRREFILCLRLDYLKEALHYVLPQIPHGLTGQLTANADKFLLNGLVSLATAGVYNVASLFGLVVEVVCTSVNRAYVPIAMSVLQSGDRERLEELRVAGTLLVALFLFFAASLTIFSRLIVGMVTSEEYAGAAVFVPFLAFTGAATGIYYILVNILFFDRRGTKLIPVGTGLGAVSTIALNLVLIRTHGAIGAAIATLSAQLILTVAIGFLARRYEVVRWDYGRFALAFIFAFAASTALSQLSYFGPLANFMVQLAGWLLVTAMIGGIIWRDPLHFPAMAWRVVSSLRVSPTTREPEQQP